MSNEGAAVTVKHSFKIEKRNAAGELYEVVEVEADGEGDVTAARVTYRREGLAPDEAYARSAPLINSVHRE